MELQIEYLMSQHGEEGLDGQIGSGMTTAAATATATMTSTATATTTTTDTDTTAVRV
jgi:hypothetical protein